MTPSQEEAAFRVGMVSEGGRLLFLESCDPDVWVRCKKIRDVWIMGSISWTLKETTV